MKKETFILQISTALKTKDPSAATVKEVLAHDMGLGKKITSVGREELWELETEAEDRESALKFGESIAKKTRVFYNPGKHVLAVGLKREDSLEEKISKEIIYSLTIRTRFTGDEKERSALKFLRETFEGAEKIRKIRRYTLWRLEINAGSREEAENIAGEVAVNESLTRGLLANPSSQEVG